MDTAKKKRIQAPWSSEARARHKAGVARYQKEREINESAKVYFEMARLIGVEVKPLLKTLIATDKVTLHKMSEIEPREERLRAFKNLVIDYCQGVTA